MVLLEAAHPRVLGHGHRLVILSGTSVFYLDSYLFRAKEPERFPVAILVEIAEILRGSSNSQLGFRYFTPAPDAFLVRWAGAGCADYDQSRLGDNHAGDTAHPGKSEAGSFTGAKGGQAVHGQSYGFL